MRQSHLTSLRAGLLAAGLGCAVLFAPGVQAASPDSQYQQDVQRCNNTPDVDRQACLKEAGAAAKAAKTSHLTTPSAQAESQNRTQRCEALSGTQRQNCLALMDSTHADTQGSVLSGGILRQHTIIIPAPVTQ